jgi:antitoxin CptB
MTLPQNTQDSPRFKRLRYQSWHRGCKETDVILGNYFDTHAHEWDDAAMTLYEQLMEEDDYDIWQWIAYDKAPPDANYLPLIERLRAFHTYSGL